MVNRGTPDQSSETLVRAETTRAETTVAETTRAETGDVALQAVLEATRQLIWVTTPAEASDVARNLITVLGGQTVPAAGAYGGDTLPVDVSFGQEVPLLPSAPQLSLARLQLERHIPSFMLDAQRALALGDKLSRQAADASAEATRHDNSPIVDKTVFDKTVVDKMVVDKMVVDKMVVDQAVVAPEVTEHPRAATDAGSLIAAEDLVRTVLHTAPFGFALVGPDGGFRMVNPWLCDLLGHDEEWFLARRVRDIIHADDLEDAQRERDPLDPVVAGYPDFGIGRTRLVRADGTTVWVRRAGVLIPYATGANGVKGEADLLLIQVQDITAEHEAQEALVHQTSHDALTGLPNRAGILAGLELDLNEAKRQGTSVGVLCVRLENFKVVNDSLGHSASDKVLETVAERIVAALRPQEHVGRLSGKQFVILVPDVLYGVEVGRCAERVSASIATELQIQEHRIVPTVSIGIVTSTSTSSPESLLRDACSALSPSNGARRVPWRFFDASMHRDALARLTVEGQLREAISAGRFVAHYQPIVNLADARVVGHEALVRWAHPTRGLLLPAEFLDVAEDTGLIRAIGAQVLDQACATLAKRSDLPGPISVNVSAVQLADPGWLRSVRGTIARHGVDPARIVIEVTETAALSLLYAAQVALTSLRRLGVGLHVDDFGTGYSSICLLRDLPVTGVKLDMMFVHDLTAGDSQANALAEGLSGLVRGMNLTGIAEGVETPMQADILANQGWECAQGAYFGGPALTPVTAVQSEARPFPTSKARPPEPWITIPEVSGRK